MAEKTIKVNVTQERLQRRVKVDDIILAQEGNMRAIRDLTAWFVLNDKGSYMDYEEAQTLLGGLTIGQLTEIGDKLMVNLEGAAVPKESAKG